jgi:GT2 family glycosyltransferase
VEGSWQPDRARTVPWAIGACLLLRRTALDAAGGFDERHWMFAEDLDLGWRLRNEGWITWYEPEARVLHESGAAANPLFGDQRSVRAMAETYALLRRRRGIVRSFGTGALNIAGVAVRLAWWLPLGRFSGRWHARAAENRLWLEAHVRGLRCAAGRSETRGEAPTQSTGC